MDVKWKLFIPLKCNKHILWKLIKTKEGGPSMPFIPHVTLTQLCKKTYEVLDCQRNN
jgi:hypothetical protein